MSADDYASFEHRLRRLIDQAVASAESIPEVGNRAAYVLGYVMGPVGYTRDELRELNQRIHCYQFAADGAQ